MPAAPKRRVPRQPVRQGECILDSNDLERERGITILAKNIALHYQGVKINIIDTPGHADFGGEVERVLRMADGALVLVDAAEGPMPQTRFVLSQGARVPACGRSWSSTRSTGPTPGRTKCSTKSSSCSWSLAADDMLADFPYIFASGRDGYATTDPEESGGDSMQPLFDMMLEAIPGPEVDARCAAADAGDHARLVRLRRPHRHRPHLRRARSRKGQHGRPDASRRSQSTSCKVAQLHVFDKLGRVEVEEATAGDIAALVGLEDVEIGDTISDPKTSIAPCRGCTVDRADAGDGVQHQQVAVRRPRGQVRHQPAAARAA